MLHREREGLGGGKKNHSISKFKSVKFSGGFFYPWENDVYERKTLKFRHVDLTVSRLYRKNMFPAESYRGGTRPCLGCCSGTVY